MTTKDKVFLTHPQLDAYFKTSDGECFYHHLDAKNWAKNLTDKAVVKVLKKDSESDTNVESEDEFMFSMEAIEREVLSEEFFELTGKKAHPKIGLDKLRQRIMDAKIAQEGSLESDDAPEDPKKEETTEGENKDVDTNMKQPDDENQEAELNPENKEIDETEN